MKPEELRRALADGAVKPVYFFYGDETYLMEREVKRFIAALVPADVADFNLDILYGADRKGAGDCRRRPDAPHVRRTAPRGGQAERRAGRGRL